MPAIDWIDYAKQGGAACAVLEIGAIWWLVTRINKQDTTIAAKDAKLETLAEEQIKGMATLLERIPSRGGST